MNPQPKNGREFFDQTVTAAVNDAVAKFKEKGGHLTRNKIVLIRLGAAAAVHHILREVRQWEDANQKTLTE